MNETFSGLLLVIIGLLVFIGAVLNWSIVNRPWKLINRLFGDTISRAIYAAVGVVLVILGSMRLIGMH